MFLGMPGLNGDSYSASQVRSPPSSLGSAASTFGAAGTGATASAEVGNFVESVMPAPPPSVQGLPQASMCQACLCALQVESLRHSMGPGSYGDNLGGGQMYSPREMRVSESPTGPVSW